MTDLRPADADQAGATARRAGRPPRPGRWLRGFTICLCLLAFSSGGAYAQQDPPGEEPDSGIVLDFQDAELRVVIAALAELAGLTVVYGGLPDRTVTLRSADPVPESELPGILRSVVEANGLELVDENGVIRIAAGGTSGRRGGRRPPQREAADEAATPPPARLFVSRLDHASAEAVARTLRNVFGLGGLGGAAPAPDGRTALSQRLRDDASAAEPLDAGGRTVAGVQQDAPASEDVESQQSERGIAAELTGPVQIVPDGLTNSVLVRANAADYETVRAAIEELDARPLQVLIEVVIAEVRRDDRFDLGVDLSVPEQRDSETGAVFGGEIEGRSAGDIALRILDLGAVGADVLLRFLASSGDVSVLSRPVVLAQNNQEARLLVGSERPFVQLFRSLPTDAAVRDQVVQYRDVGTQLTIRPTINPDGYVTLSVLQEVSTATAETQFGAPVISTREAETQLLVRDGHTAVIGGLIGRQREETEGGIPVLKDIPLLGTLFRSTHRRRGTTELFLLLTPHVLRTDRELDEASERLPERSMHLRDALPIPTPLLPPPDTMHERKEES